MSGVFMANSELEMEYCPYRVAKTGIADPYMCKMPDRNGSKQRCTWHAREVSNL